MQRRYGRGEHGPGRAGGVEMCPDLVAQGAQLAQRRVDVGMAIVGVDRVCGSGRNSSSSSSGGGGSGGWFLMVDVVDQTQGVGGG